MSDLVITRYVLFLGIWLASPSPLFAESTIQARYSIQGVSGSLSNLIKEELKAIQLPEDSMQPNVMTSTKMVREILEAYGYFRADIKTETKSTVQGYNISYIIEPGPQLPMATLSIQLVGEGKTHTALQNKVAALLRQQGAAMTTDNYESMKQALYKTSISEGYLDATWKTHTVAIDLESYTATITLMLETGPRYRIGPIQYSDSLPSHDTDFFKKYLTFQEGDPYQLNKVLQSQIQLQNSGYLQKALIETSTTHAEIPVTITAMPTPKYYGLFGLGFSADIGIRATIEGLVRRLNKRGHQIASIAQLSRTRLYTSGLYTIPGRSPTTQNHHIQLEYIAHYNKTHAEESWFPMISHLFNHRQIENPTAILSYLFIWDYLHWKIKPFISLHYARFKPTTLERPYIGLIPGLSISNTHTNWFKDTHHYHLWGQIQATTPFSRVHLLKLESEMTYFRHLKPWLPSSYFILRGQYGSVITSSLGDIPPHLRFYAGGYHYPRGHKKYQLGAHTFGGGVEIRKHFVGLLYFNPFFDINYDTDYKSTTVKGSAGIGLCLWYPSIGHIEISGVIRTHDTSQGRYGVITKISASL